jgi:hypothetical protein
VRVPRRGGGGCASYRGCPTTLGSSDILGLGEFLHSRLVACALGLARLSGVLGPLLDILLARGIGWGVHCSDVIVSSSEVRVQHCNVINRCTRGVSCSRQPSNSLVASLVSDLS